MENNKNQPRELKELGEFGLIEHLTNEIELSHKSTIKGVGDDAAVLNHSKQIVVTTDLLTEGVHFDLMYVPLKHLGYKAIMVNLSDVYAMNAIPTQVTVSIALSGKFSLDAIELLYEGIHLACKNYNVDLVGGDTCSSVTGLTISVTAIGEVEKGKETYRNGAQVGDLICVSGDLGAAYAGLQVLEREKKVYKVNPNSQPDLSQYDYILERQLKPEARKDIVEAIREANIQPSAMIDISDGLSSELIHICKQSKCGAKISEAKLPIHEQTGNFAEELNMDPTLFAMNGGEDYELMIIVKPEDATKLNEVADISIVGEILDESEGLKLYGRGEGFTHIKAQGWNAYDE